MTEVHGTSADGRGRQTSDSNKQARERHIFTATWPISPNVIPGNRKRQRVFKKNQKKNNLRGCTRDSMWTYRNDGVSRFLQRSILLHAKHGVGKTKNGREKSKKKKIEK